MFFLVRKCKKHVIYDVREADLLVQKGQKCVNYSVPSSRPQEGPRRAPAGLRGADLSPRGLLEALEAVILRVLEGCAFHGHRKIHTFDHSGQQETL